MLHFLQLIASQTGFYSGQYKSSDNFFQCILKWRGELLLNRRCDRKWWFSCQLTDSCSAAQPWDSYELEARQRPGYCQRSKIQLMTTSAVGFIVESTPHPVLCVKLSVLIFLSDLLYRGVCLWFTALNSLVVWARHGDILHLKLKRFFCILSSVRSCYAERHRWFYLTLVSLLLWITLCSRYIYSMHGGCSLWWPLHVH